MSDHTPEPWKVLEWADGSIGIYTMDNDTIANLAHMGPHEDARRIVACVNACRGIPTERLEETQNVGMSYLELREEVAKMDAEIAEAVEALEKIHNVTEAWETLSDSRGWVSGNIDALIAKLKGVVG